jgi:hypothetical protein
VSDPLIFIRREYRTYRMYDTLNSKLARNRVQYTCKHMEEFVHVYPISDRKKCSLLIIVLDLD